MPEEPDIMMISRHMLTPFRQNRSVMVGFCTIEMLFEGYLIFREVREMKRGIESLSCAN